MDLAMTHGGIGHRPYPMEVFNERIQYKVQCKVYDVRYGFWHNMVDMLQGCNENVTGNQSIGYGLDLEINPCLDSQLFICNDFWKVIKGIL